MGLAMGQKMAASLAGASSSGGPPPLPGAAPRYFLGISGQQIGPLDMNGLRTEIQAGRLGRATLVWKEGMSSWEPAERVPEVSCLLPPDAPPPLTGGGA